MGSASHAFACAVKKDTPGPVTCSGLLTYLRTQSEGRTCNAQCLGSICGLSTISAMAYTPRNRHVACTELQVERAGVKIGAVARVAHSLRGCRQGCLRVVVMVVLAGK